MLGDDILSSDYDPTIGETWPGVNMDMQTFQVTAEGYRAADLPLPPFSS